MGEDSQQQMKSFVKIAHFGGQCNAIEYPEMQYLIEVVVVALGGPSIVYMGHRNAKINLIKCLLSPKIVISTLVAFSLATILEKTVQLVQIKIG